MLNAPNGKTLVKAIIAIVESIGADSVAEGVELASQARFIDPFARAQPQGWDIAQPSP